MALSESTRGLIIIFLEKIGGTTYKPIYAYNLNESTPGVGKLTHDKIMVAFSAMMGLSISNKTCLSPCITTLVKSRSITDKLKLSMVIVCPI